MKKKHGIDFLESFHTDCAEIKISVWCEKNRAYMKKCPCDDYLNQEGQKVHIEHFKPMKISEKVRCPYKNISRV